MCNCGTSSSQAPNSGGSANANPAAAIQVCPGFDSSILLIDELGMPYNGVSVAVKVGGQAEQTRSTDAEGRICFTDPPGTAVEVTVPDTHEAKTGESTVTSSGKHFGHLKPGP